MNSLVKCELKTCASSIVTTWDLSLALDTRLGTSPPVVVGSACVLRPCYENAVLLRNAVIEAAIPVIRVHCLPRRILIICAVIVNSGCQVRLWKQVDDALDLRVRGGGVKSPAAARLLNGTGFPE